MKLYIVNVVNYCSNLRLSGPCRSMCVCVNTKYIYSVLGICGVFECVFICFEFSCGNSMYVYV